MAVTEPEGLSSLPAAEVLRRWCLPQRILAVADSVEEERLVFECIQQARRSTAAVILTRVLPADRRAISRRAASSPQMPSAAAESAQRTLERLSCQIRWMGIPCEPVLLKGDPTEEILALSKAYNVDRLLMPAQCAGRMRMRTLAEEVAPWAGVPVCTVPSQGRLGQNSWHAAGRITLALNLHPSCELLLRFAGRLAQEQNAALTILHVSEMEDAGALAIDRITKMLMTRCLGGSLREAQLLCPVEVAVRSGEPAIEVLKHVAHSDQDFLIVGAPHSPCADTVEHGSPVHKIVHEARCPVMFVGPSRLQRRADDLIAAMQASR